MAIMTEFINLIVPIRKIEEKYPGGWAQCLKDHAESIGRRIWFDDHLFRDGAMNPMDMKALVEEWEEMGFTLYLEKDGRRYWEDVCVYEGMLGGATMPCNWLDEDRKRMTVSLKGAPECELIGRGSN